MPCTDLSDRFRMARMNNGVLPQRPEFEVTVSTDDGVRVVAVSGELDLDTMGELNEVLAADNGLLVTTVVDLRGLTFIDSSGVSGLMAAARRARDAGARLVCVPGPPQIRRVFEMTGIDTVIEWVDSPGEVA
jgi:anti-anti-sigma factor